MKKLLLISISVIAITIFVNSCKPKPVEIIEAQACFIAEKDTVYMNEPVTFVNCSNYYDSFSWSFGDGVTNNEDVNPTHYYTQKGDYLVRLEVSGETTEIASKTVVVLGSTDLDILVKYYQTNDPASDCDVKLYSNETDYLNSTNPVVTAKTGATGNVIFTRLQPQIYYVDIYKSTTSTDYWSNKNLITHTSALNVDEVNYYTFEVKLETVK